MRSYPRRWTARRFRARVTVVSALLCVVVATLTRSAPSAADFSAVDAYVKKVMQKDRVPGLALAIVRDGTLVHARGFGTAGGKNRPVTPQSVFVLGSMSKAFTAIAVMQLAAATKVDLDAPAQRYLPWFRSSKPITLRHLLHHTSGIPRTVTRPAASPPTLESHVRALQDIELLHSPGDAHVYSSANYLVLGLIVEQVSGKPFGQYVEQHIFDPLGMSNSHAEAEQVASNTLAEGHSLWLGTPRVSRQRHEADRLPTAALLSSAEDLSHLLIALSAGGRYKDGRILSEASTAELLRPVAKGGGFSYAMGFRVGEIGGVSVVHHGGIVSNYRGKMVLLPEQKTGVVILTNVSSVVGKPTSHVIANGVALMLAGKSPPRTGLSLSTWYLLIGLGHVDR